MDSVMPSVRYSISGSALVLMKGRIASDFPREREGRVVACGTLAVSRLRSAIARSLLSLGATLAAGTGTERQAQPARPSLARLFLRPKSTAA